MLYAELKLTLLLLNSDWLYLRHRTYKQLSDYEHSAEWNWRVVKNNIKTKRVKISAVIRTKLQVMIDLV